MANMGSTGVVKYFETFATDTINSSSQDGVGWFTSTDTTGGVGDDTAFGRAVAVGRGLHIEAILAAADNHRVEFCGDTLMFAAEEGHSAVEVLLQLSDVTFRAFFFGFNDDVLEANAGLPMDLATTVVAANAETAVGILYDVDATNDELHCVWVNGTTVGQTDSTGKVDGKTIRMDGMSPKNSEWLWMRVEMQDLGSGKGARVTFIAVDNNGRSIEKVFNTSLTRSTPMCYYLAVANRSDSTCTVYVKMPSWEQGN